MTPQQALEIDRLASLLATARVQKYRVSKGELAPLTKVSAQRRVDKARCALVQALNEFVPAGGPLSVTAESVDAHRAWRELVEGCR